MIRAEQFRLLAVQAVIYLADPEDFSPSVVLSAVLPPYAARYNGDVQALTLPSDIPPEIPHVILQSNPAGWQLRASPARIDSIWHRASLDEEYNDVITESAEVLESYVRTSNTRIGRVALVISRFSIVEQPTTELITHFCNDRVIEHPLRRSQVFEIHNHKVYTPDSIGSRVNSWVRCKSGEIVPPGSPAIIVEQDLNTLEGELTSNIFSAERLHAYFENASREADGILREYFPQEVE